MGMVVQHNITAMNSNRMLGTTTKAQAKSTEKLSSGYKINRAADDAAGLSISEKMRKQMRGLTQASANAQDGISAVQTAEGALNEVQDMLQRMNELAVKSANGTNSESDRKAIQDEIDQLTTEIDRVSETTKFNETYLLKGDRDADKDFTYQYKEASAKVATATTNIASAKTSGLSDITYTFKDKASGEQQNEVAKLLRDQGLSISYTSSAAASNPTDNTIRDVKANVQLNGTDKYVVSGSGTSFSIKDRKTGDAIVDIAITNANVGTDIAKADAAKATENPDKVTADTVTAGYKNGETVKYYDRDGNAISENALNKYFTSSNNSGTVTTEARADAPQVYDALGNITTIDAANDVEGKQDLTGALSLSLQVGADATKNNQITFNIDAMSTKGLGINGLKVDGADDINARNAVETIKEAISKVSTQRSGLGAIQNRLEHTIANLDNVVENTTAAESQIRDTDMASEMVTYSKNNILAQAGQSMLAQANQSNQGVLSLLG